jgi:hypothetical protein
MPQNPTFELKDWQTAIGAFAGFLAIIVGALWNYHLNRRRDARLRAEEALSIAAAYYGEIVALQNELAILSRAVAWRYISRGEDSVTKIDENFIEAYGLSEPVLYKALASKLGLLSADLIIPIVKFYAYYMDARRSLHLLVDRADRGYEFSYLTVLRPANDAIKFIAPVLRKIETLASIELPFVAPDMQRANDVIEIEEINRETPTNNHS